jgi:hypothetical protein
MSIKFCFFAVLLCCGAAAASAQAACGNTTDGSVCHEPERSSVVHRVGDWMLITWKDGAMSRQGEFSVVTDSSQGVSGVAHHVGDTTTVNLEKFTVVCTTTGASTLCIKS